MCSNSGDGRIVIIGIGNSFRRDDGVGLRVVERLKEKEPRDVSIAKLDREASSLINCWRNAELAVVVDAMALQEQVGRVHRIDLLSSAISFDTFSFSTHFLSLPEAIELSRVLELLPSRLLLYGIEGADFKNGTGLSPEVEGVVDEVVASILTDIETISERSGGNNA